jgi:hypothetical protein
VRSLTEEDLAEAGGLLESRRDVDDVWVTNAWPEE